MASKNPPSDALAPWLASQRWFASKSQRIVAADYDDVVPLPHGRVAFVAVRLDDGSVHRYAVPLAPVAAGDIRDGLGEPSMCLDLLALIRNGGTASGERGEIRGVPSAAFPATLPRELDVRRIGGEQSNTSVVFGNAVIVKHFRRIVSGLNPEAEVTRFLTERTTFRNAPQLFGHLEYRDAKGDVATLAVAQEVVAQAQDGWQWVLAELRAMSERARGAAPDPTTLRDAAASTLDALRRLGTRTAELHRALGSDPRDPAFAPEPIRREDLELWSDAVRRQVSAAFSALGRGKPPDARNVVDGLAGLLGRHRIRHHGDFHLGQTLYQPERGDFVIIDFEGEPLRPFDERRRKHAALRDVAGMLRSIDYAAATGVPVGLEAWSSAWRAAAAEEFVAAYRAGAAGAMFVPDSERAFDAAVAVFELEKAAYEVVYEANNRPDWIGIPTRGLDRALSAISGRAAAGAA